MRRPYNETDIKKALDHMIESFGLTDKLRETRIREAFGKCMGPYIVKHTRSIRYAKGKLTVSVESSVIRNEMNMVKSALIQKINQELKEDLIRDIEVF